MRIEAREQNVSFPTAYYGTLYYNVRASGRSNKETRDGVEKERERERQMTSSRQETVNRSLHHEPRGRVVTLNQRA